MRRDYVYYAILMFIVATILAWIVYPYWSDAVWWYTTYGNWGIGNTTPIYAGMIFVTCLSVILYVSGVILLWKGIRDLGYCP